MSLDCGISDQRPDGHRGLAGAAPGEGRRSRGCETLLGYGASILTVGACSALCFAMRPFFDPANLIMVYLLGTIFIAIQRGLGAAFLSAVLGVLAFDLIFVPPLYVVAVSDTQYLFTVTTMFAVAVVVSRLTGFIRAQADDARAREANTRLMLTLTRELVGARGTGRLLAIVTQQIERLYGFHAVAYLAESGGVVLEPGDSYVAVKSPEDASEPVRWVLENGMPAGLGTTVLAHSEGLYLPLAGIGGTLGVLAIWPMPLRRELGPEQVHMLENLARQVGLMLEVERLEAERMRHQVEAESERLKTTLLSSVTHDLQTPLAAILGSAESLVSCGGDMDADERSRLAANIHDEAARLSRLVSNLLRMTRLQSGAVKPDFQLQHLDEAVGSALVLMERQLSGRPVSVDIPEQLPRVELDDVLMEQYLVNVLENIVKYTPPGSPVDIAARSTGAVLELVVADRGPGLASGELAKVFDLFYQGQAAEGLAGSRRGYGIGLAVCRAVAQTHGGEVVAVNRAGGGTEFRLTLPLPANTKAAAFVPEER